VLLLLFFCDQSSFLESMQIRDIVEGFYQPFCYPTNSVKTLKGSCNCSCDIVQVMCTDAAIPTAHIQLRSAVSWRVTLVLCIFRFVHTSARNAAARSSNGQTSSATKEHILRKSRSRVPTAVSRAHGETSSKNTVQGITRRRMAMTWKT